MRISFLIECLKVKTGALKRLEKQMKILEAMIALPKGTGTTEFFVESVRAMLDAGAEIVILCKNTCDVDFRGLNVYADVSELPCDYRPDAVHIHAMWSPFLSKIHRWARRHGVPVVVSPHGSLSPWAIRSKWWKKVLYWFLVEKPDLKRVIAFHVTAPLEGAWVRKCGFCQPQITVPLGVRIPKESHRISKIGSDGCRIIISIGRIYRVKGLDRIAEAIAILKQRGVWRGWKMVMAGPDWMDYRRELEAKLAELDLLNDISLPGAMYDESKDVLFRSASIYVAASFTENFCQPVAESLTYCVPVIASKGCPWKGLEDHGCGIWTENSPENLANAMARLMILSDEERLTMGRRGQEWMQNEYGWPAIGEALLKGMKQCVGAELGCHGDVFGGTGDGF